MLKTVDVVRMSLKGIPRDAADDVAKAVSDLIDIVEAQGLMILNLQNRVAELEARAEGLGA